MDWRDKIYLWLARICCVVVAAAGLHLFATACGDAIAGRLHNRQPAGGVQVFIGETTQVFDGAETVPTGNADWGRYSAFPGLVIAANSDLLWVGNRSAGHGSEDGALAWNRSLSGSHRGRVWMDKIQESPNEIENDDAYQEEGAGCSQPVTGAAGRIGCVYQRVDQSASPPLPSRQIRYRFSDDHGATWSAATVFSSYGTEHSSCGCSAPIVLGDGRMLVAGYTRDAGETRYTARMYVASATSAGNAWYQRSIIAQDAEAAPGGPRQFEEPICRRLQTGRIMCLIRDDLGNGGSPFGSATIWRNYDNSDDGATWTTPEAVFPGNGKPEWIQLTNGNILAVTRNPTSPNRGTMWVSSDGGVSFLGPREWQYSAAQNGAAYEYAAMVEHSTNIAGIVHHQEKVSGTGTFFLFTEVGVNAQPSVRFRQSQRWRAPNAGDSYATYPDTNMLDGATSAIFFLRFRVDGATAGGTQVILSQDAVNQRAFTIRIDASFRPLVAIAQNLTTLASCTVTSPVIQSDVEYDLLARFDGSQTGNNRLFVDINGAAATCSYSGTFPASMTSPAAGILLGSDQQAPTSDDLRNTFVAPVVVWRNPGTCDATCASNIYNGREPQDFTAYSIGGSTPRVYLPLNGSYTDVAGTLSAPTITGAPTFSTAWPL